MTGNRKGPAKDRAPDDAATTQNVEDRVAPAAKEAPPWAWVPTQAACYPLSRGALRVFVLLAAHANRAEGWRAWPSKRRITTLLGLSQSSVRHVTRWIQELESAGFIRVRFEYRNGAHATNSYWILPPEGGTTASAEGESVGKGGDGGTGHYLGAEMATTPWLIPPPPSGQNGQGVEADSATQTDKGNRAVEPSIEPIREPLHVTVAQSAENAL